MVFVDDLGGHLGVSAAVFNLERQHAADEAHEGCGIGLGLGLEVFSATDIGERLENHVLQRAGDFVLAALLTTAEPDTFRDRHVSYLTPSLAHRGRTVSSPHTQISSTATQRGHLPIALAMAAMNAAISSKPEMVSIAESFYTLSGSGVGGAAGGEAGRSG